MRRLERGVFLAEECSQWRDHIRGTVPSRMVRRGGFSRTVDIWRSSCQHPQTGAGVVTMPPERLVHLVRDRRGNAPRLVTLAMCVSSDRSLLSASSASRCSVTSWIAPHLLQPPILVSGSRRTWCVDLDSAVRIREPDPVIIVVNVSSRQSIFSESRRNAPSGWTRLPICSSVRVRSGPNSKMRSSSPKRDSAPCQCAARKLPVELEWPSARNASLRLSASSVCFLYVVWVSREHRAKDRPLTSPNGSPAHLKPAVHRHRNVGIACLRSGLDSLP